MKNSISLACLAIVFGCCQTPVGAEESEKWLRLAPESFKKHVDYFNRMEPETQVQAVSNAESWKWIASSIPFFECPQDNFEEIYYFRWWSLRKHIRETPSGYAFTEFLVPRSYADQHNMISCALGHHIMEARWIRSNDYLNQYIHLWFRGNHGEPMAKLHKFSSWAPFAIWQKYLVDHDRDYVVNLLPDLDREYGFWQTEHLRPDKLYWQYDVRDGMEEQISGSRIAKNGRPTINSYMPGNAKAIREIARLANHSELEGTYREKGEAQQKLLLEKLWNPKSQFFETVYEDGTFAEVREQTGYLPWYFDLALPKHDVAWDMTRDEKGFLAPFGLTTAERSHPKFRSHGCCKCEWDGAVWPFATSQTLTAMANRLQSGGSPHLDRAQYFQHLKLYVESQYYRGRPYIGEYLDEVTGYWLKGDQERSKYYNHSTFADLVITGLVGLRPRSDDKIEINPLLPENTWDWFCLDGVSYHGHLITVQWDKNGERYQTGTGLQVYVDGRLVGRSPSLSRIEVAMSE